VSAAVARRGSDMSWLDKRERLMWVPDLRHHPSGGLVGLPFHI
jgi:hypothetical protein